MSQPIQHLYCIVIGSLLFVSATIPLMAAVPPSINHEDHADRLMFLKAAKYLELNDQKKLAAKYYRVALSQWKNRSQREDQNRACHEYYKLKSNLGKKIPPEKHYEDCSSEFRDRYFGRVDRREIPIFRKEPRYPSKAAKLKMPGWVILKYDVTADGKVTRISVHDSSDPLFEEAAITSHSKSRYLPAIVNGVPATVHNSLIRIQFEQ